MFGRRYKRQIEELEASVGRLLSQLEEERTGRITVNIELIDRVERLERVYESVKQILERAAITIAKYRNALRDEIMEKYRHDGEPPPIWLREIREMSRRIGELEEAVYD